jgi:hypothetical protein
MIEPENQDAYKKKFEYIQAMADLDTKEKEIKSSQGYGKAYLWSVLLPPIGIYYFIKYTVFANEEKKNINAGLLALVLTLLSLLISIWLTAEIFKQSASVIPSQNFQMLKDLANPDNQKNLLQLYK